eukprot:542737_1
MGKGLQFLQNKYTHPTNAKQRQKKHAAQQKEKHRKLKQKERQLQLEKEQEEYLIQQTLLAQTLLAQTFDKTDSKKYDTALKRHQLSFLYKEPSHFNKHNNSKKTEQLKQLNDLKSNANMTSIEKNIIEKQIEKNMSIHDRNAHRFDILKNAPITHDYVKNIDVVHKPFGKQIKHVKCVKCGEWGHKIFDRECRFSEYNPLQINKNNNSKSNANKINDDPISHMKLKQTNERYMQSENNIFKLKSFEYNDGTDLALIQHIDSHKKLKKDRKRIRKNKKNSKRHKHRKRNRHRSRSRSRSRHRKRA